MEKTFTENSNEFFADLEIKKAEAEKFIEILNKLSSFRKNINSSNNVSEKDKENYLNLVVKSNILSLSLDSWTSCYLEQISSEISFENEETAKSFVSISEDYFDELDAEVNLIDKKWGVVRDFSHILDDEYCCDCECHDDFQDDSDCFEASKVLPN